MATTPMPLPALGSVLSNAVSRKNTFYRTRAPFSRKMRAHIFSSGRDQSFKRPEKAQVSKERPPTHVASFLDPQRRGREHFVSLQNLLQSEQELSTHNKCICACKRSCVACD